MPYKHGNQLTYEVAIGYHAVKYHTVQLPRYLLYFVRSPLGENGVVGLWGKLAVAVLANIFQDVPDQGLYILPAVAYHSVQMVVAASLLGHLRRLAEKTEG